MIDCNLNEDIGVEELTRGNTTKCIVYAVGRQTTERLRLRRSTAININDMDMESDDDEDENICNTCKQKFTHAFRMEIHVCKGTIGQQDFS